MSSPTLRYPAAGRVEYEVAPRHYLMVLSLDADRWGGRAGGPPEREQYFNDATRWVLGYAMQSALWLFSERCAEERRAKLANH